MSQAKAPDRALAGSRKFIGSYHQFRLIADILKSCWCLIKNSLSN